MTSFSRTRTAFLLATSLAAPLGAQNVLVVDDDGGPGILHTDIQSAIAASAAGDVVLILDGAYGDVFVDRPISLIADIGAEVEIEMAKLGRNAATVVRTPSSHIGLRFTDELARDPGGDET